MNRRENGKGVRAGSIPVKATMSDEKFVMPKRENIEIIENVIHSGTPKVWRKPRKQKTMPMKLKFEEYRYEDFGFAVLDTRRIALVDFN